MEGSFTWKYQEILNSYLEISGGLKREVVLIGAEGGGVLVLYHEIYKGVLKKRWSSIGG